MHRAEFMPPSQLGQVGVEFFLSSTPVGENCVFFLLPPRNAHIFIPAKLKFTTCFPRGAEMKISFKVFRTWRRTAAAAAAVLRGSFVFLANCCARIVFLAPGRDLKRRLRVSIERRKVLMKPLNLTSGFLFPEYCFFG